MAKVKCQFCNNDARVYYQNVPMCQNCIQVVKLNVERILNAIREDNWREDDKREITEIEKRYTRCMAVKGSD